MESSKGQHLFEV